ncbi:hypothetical protein DFH11DRAFT_1503507 [Phellopilus nigrolimitatus]|nr:hypothetical protein DFH11DRAFT_1503507 [Phellopilus nigrolimitatus]
MGKNRLFSFSSRTLLRSRVNLFEINSNKKEASQASLRPASNPLNEHALPTPEQLRIAASLLVVSESGVRVRFGDLWEHHQAVVIFIRHFRFSGCQDYVRSITSDVDIEALEKAGLKIVIVGLGSPSLIAPYRQITGASFPIYTDPSLAVYRALSMSLKPTGAGSESTHQYVVSGNTIKTLGGLRRTLAARFVLPLFERGGDAAQLGGEFVLGPGREKGKGGKGGCVFAHRMQHAHAHTPILDVIAASGVQSLSARRMGRMQVQVQLQLQQGQGRGKRCESMEDEDAWMARRRRSLVRLRLKRQKRRDGGAQQVAAAEEDELNMEKSVPRFPVVEEDEDEDEDDEGSRRYELRVEVY